MSSIFSTYSTGENRVTASILAVLRSLSLGRIERLLGALLEESEFELIRFQNQPSKGGDTVPDAIIQASVRILVETKVKLNAVNEQQVNGHLSRLNDATESTALLLVVTPDEVRPKVLDGFSDDRIAWTSFTMLNDAIEELVEDKHEVISEREEFLLRELQNMLTAEGLLSNAYDVVVVAARNAWPEYNDVHAYICQKNRSFQKVGRIGFYSKGVVYPLVPKILDVFEDVEMKHSAYKGELGRLVNRLLDERRRTEGMRSKVFLLSSPESSDTLTLREPIPNDKKSKTGKPTAFTMGQRYVSSESLLNANTTSDLD